MFQPKCRNNFGPARISTDLILFEYLKNVFEFDLKFNDLEKCQLYFLKKTSLKGLKTQKGTWKFIKISQVHQLKPLEPLKKYKT